mmetsp:Transcript_37479/g.121888  ORF Transcript_37479/g.121888 Transcript_37479/m.121888 type:complete len:533 (-) Transcript_37479:457-2055(-)
MALESASASALAPVAARDSVRCLAMRRLCHQAAIAANQAVLDSTRSISAAAAEAAAGAFALLSRADSDSLPARPPSLSFEARAAPNISVVVPCYGHVPYLEQTLMSVVTQRYPPAEILVLDDGSEERCGDAAAAMLRRPALARPRRRQVLTLVGWWGWSSADLARFEDEVVVTPNRGVAHARNAGIRRARGDWIMCLDGDDTVSDSYLMRAMEQVALVPRTNLVYANQQFFDGSRWQWTVPPLRADNALVNGPLPLMTLWRKDLWLATPHGFDEALPKGHEDWAFWLQLTRLPLLPHKLDDFLTQYRYKKDSKMRTRERNNPEVPRLMRTLFADLCANLPRTFLPPRPGRCLHHRPEERPPRRSIPPPPLCPPPLRHPPTRPPTRPPDMAADTSTARPQVPGAQAADRPPRAAQASRRAGPEAGHHRGGRHGRLRLAAPPPHPPGAAPLVGDDPAGKGRPGRRGGRVQRLRRARRAVRLAGLLPPLAGAAPARRRRRSGARGGGAPPAVGGDAQMRWYSTDAYGDVLPAASE